jgi:Kef-type K+ transport system membrane component KefB
MPDHDLSVLIFLQLGIILVFVRLIGKAARKVGQPQVVGEMIAGVLLGPSLFGWLFPEIQQAIFPPETIPVLYILAQVGLVIYMFLIGTEFNINLLRPRLRSAISVSIAGITTPFILGAVITLLIFDNQTFFSPGIHAWEAMLFTGAAMSITAFPMLARIIHERGLANTSMGTLALAAGSIDDTAAWCLLAVVLASFSGDASIAFRAVGGGILYGGLVFVMGKPLLRRLDTVVERARGLSGQALSIILILLMFGAWFTDLVGIYAVFGAFVLGMAIPRGRVTEELHRKVEPLTTNLLLPLFFVYSGLNTQLGLVISPELWGITLVIVTAAIAGKFIACWGAARLSGETQANALAIGALMNARGLMELILLNIGLQRGIITPTMFTVLVIMTIITTLMASPVFDFVSTRFMVTTRLPAQSENEAKIYEEVGSTPLT